MSDQKKPPVRVKGFADAVAIGLRRWKGRIVGSHDESNDADEEVQRWLETLATLSIPGAIFEPKEITTGAGGEAEAEESRRYCEQIVFPTTLTAAQRRTVHKVAVKQGLYHASCGADGERYVVVSLTKDFGAALSSAPTTKATRDAQISGVKPHITHRYFTVGEHELERLAASQQEAAEALLEQLDLRVDAEEEFGDLATEDGALRTLSDLVPRMNVDDIVYIDTAEALEALGKHLDACSVFSFDLEANSLRSFHGVTCLLQISTVGVEMGVGSTATASGGEGKGEREDGEAAAGRGGRNFVVDVFAVWESIPRVLAKHFADPGTLKVAHSVSGTDVPALFRDFGIVIVNAFDTYEAAKYLGEKHAGLANLLATHGVPEHERVVHLKQQYQRCDWRLRPLSKEHLEYACCDVHYLIPLYRLLKKRVVDHATAPDYPPAPRIPGPSSPPTAQEEQQPHEGGGLRRLLDTCEEEEGEEEDDDLFGGSDDDGDFGEEDDEEDPKNLLELRYDEAHDILGTLAHRGEFSGEIDLQQLEDEDDDDLWDGWGEPEVPMVGGGTGDDAGNVNGNGSGGNTFSFGNLGLVDTSPAVTEEDKRDRVDSFSGHIAQPSTSPLDLGSSMKPHEDRRVDAIAGTSGGSTSGSSGTTATGAGSAPLEATTDGRGLPLDEGAEGLRTVLSLSQKACLRLWKPKQYSRDAWMREKHFLRASKARDWTNVHSAVFRELYSWRLAMAKQHDESPWFICQTDFLLDIARASPTDVETLLKVMMPLPPLFGDGTNAASEALFHAVRTGLVEKGKEHKVAHADSAKVVVGESSGVDR